MLCLVRPTNTRPALEDRAVNQDEMLKALNKRVESLEMTSAFQERTISALDEVVRVFADRVDKLEMDITRLGSSKTEEAIGPQNDPPPHYQEGS